MVFCGTLPLFTVLYHGEIQNHRPLRVVHFHEIRWYTLHAIMQLKDLLYFDHFPWFITHYSPNFIWQAKPIFNPLLLSETFLWGWSIISGFGGSIILDLPGQLAWIIHSYAII